MKGATVSFIFRDNKKSFFIALSDILGIILHKCIMKLWLDSKDFFFFFLEKKPNSYTLREVCQALNGASTDIVLQNTLTIVMHTNVYELGWCKCEISVAQKMNSGLEKLWPEFEADLSQQLTQ